MITMFYVDASVDSPFGFSTVRNAIEVASRNGQRVVLNQGSVVLGVWCPLSGFWGTKPNSWEPICIEGECSCSS